jgi:chitinase
MRHIELTGAIMAFLLPIAHAAFSSSAEEAQEALQSYIDRNPISTVSAAQSQASATDLESLKAAVLAGNFTPSRSWEFLRNPCPGSCTSLGIESSAWPVFSSVDRLSQCDETMLLDFALYTDINGAAGQVKIRGCTADLYTDSTSFGNSSCNAPEKSKTVTTSLQLGWDSGMATGSVSEVVAALEQLVAYETMNPYPCNETINFAYAGKTSVGIYMGSALHRQGLLTSILEDLIDRVEQEGVTETTVVQLCDSRTSRYSMGVIINSNEDLLATQMAVQSWRDTSCLDMPENTITWNNLTYSVPVLSNSTSHWTRRDTGVKVFAREDTCTAIQVVSDDTCTTLASECGITATELYTYNPSSTLCSTLAVGQWICCTSGSAPDYAPSPDADDNCYSYTVETGDTCATLAATYTITVDDIESWNNGTWGWMGCDDLLANENICLSSGWPPMPAVISNAVCGPQVNGTAAAPHGADLSTLNECPLNACCDIWGQCGVTSEFCTPSNSTTGAPGTAANGTNGCISNCGTQIVESDAPAENYVIGYFEGFDLERACLKPLITEIDTSAYTHIHMSFATLNTDFSFNISSIEEQMDSFINLEGVKRVVTVGGWSFSTDASTYDIFREAVSTSANRDTLVTNTIDFLNTYDLDGINWDWEYPGEPDIPGIPADTSTSANNLFLFLMELNEQMPSGKTISTTVPSSYWYMKAYPMEAISQVVDYVVMMTYDLHGQWDWNNTQTDPGCPTGSCLRSHVNLTETLSSMSMITKAGVPSNMVVLGVASYARSFQMSEAGCYGVDCYFTGPESGADPGPCTDTAGYISNVELSAIADDTSVYTYIDIDSNSNIMVWDDTQWAGFMDTSIKDSRRELYNGMNFLGTADWAIDLLNGSTSTSNSTTSYLTTTTGTVTTAPTTTASNPYPYTITDASGDVVACASELVLEYEGGTSTVCVGSVTTISEAPSTSTEVVVVTVTVHPTSTSTDVVIVTPTQTSTDVTTTTPTKTSTDVTTTTPTKTSTDVATATPTPAGFGIMVFSDTECKDYITGYTWKEQGTCYDVGTDINSWIVTAESNSCDGNSDAVFEFWYVTTDCNEGMHTPNPNSLFID